MTQNNNKQPQPERRKPGRPRRFDADTVLDSALDLFWKHGYSTTTTRELETKLGLSQSSLYNEFGSKHALLESALDRYEALTNKALMQPLEDSEQGLAAIGQFFSSLAQWVTDEGRRGCMLINMMAEDGGNTETVTRRTRGYRNRVRGAFKDCLKRAALTGESPVADIEERADLLLGLVLGFNIAARGGASQPELHALLRAVNRQLEAWAKT